MQQQQVNTLSVRPICMQPSYLGLAKQVCTYKHS
jgi:hypothetical protein